MVTDSSKGICAAGVGTKLIVAKTWGDTSELNPGPIRAGVTDPGAVALTYAHSVDVRL